MKRFFSAMVAKAFGKTRTNQHSPLRQVLQLEDRLNPTFLTQLESIPLAGDRVAAWDEHTVISGTRPGQTNMVAWTTSQRQVKEFQPFEPSFDRGVFVATGDIDGDGLRDLVVSPDEGGGPRVQVRRNDGTVMLDFFGIDDQNFRGGVRTAVGDIDGDGYDDVAVAAGFGGGPRVTVYDGKALSEGRPQKLIHDFFAFEPTLRNGCYVGVGDQNLDGFGELIIGAGPGGGPRVTVYDGKFVPQGSRSVLTDGFVGDPHSRSGVRVAGGTGVMVTAPGGEGSATVKRLDTQQLLIGNVTGSFAAFDDDNDIALLGVDLGRSASGPRYLAYRWRVEPVEVDRTPEPQPQPEAPAASEELPPGWLPQGTPGGEPQVPLPPNSELPLLGSGSGPMDNGYGSGFGPGGLTPP